MRRFILMLVCVSYAAVAPAQQVRISTNLGEIIIDLDEEKAPVTVDNFLGLVDSGAYDDTIFHRVIPGFMVQGGGHYLDMTEAEESEAIRNEAANGLLNVRGAVAMARMNEIDSASRQFFINVVANDRLNHSEDSCTREDEATAAAARGRGIYKPMTCKTFGYAVFGKVSSGMDVVDLIEVTETTTVEEYDDVPVTPIIILSMERVVSETVAND